MEKCPFAPAKNIDQDSELAKSPVGNYSEYLQLNSLLQLQVRRTDDPLAHDEHLFIVMHQNTELWFKQILYELQSIQQILHNSKVCEKSQQIVFQRLVRINCILRIMVQQFEIMETMSSIDFQAFRGIFKDGQSGFQSSQFRSLEKIIGIKEGQRCCTFFEGLSDDKKEVAKDMDDQEDICSLIFEWLSRTPALDQFITSYEKVVGDEVKNLLHAAEEIRLIDPSESDNFSKEAESMRSNFAIIFDSHEFENSSRKQGRRIPYLAFMGALMINCYATEPRFSVPYEIIKNLVDMDELLAKWRFAHAMMAKRIIGGRQGTGGSKGYIYLRSTVSDRYMPFVGLFEVASFVLPPQKLPALTPSMKREISRVYTG